MTDRIEWERRYGKRGAEPVASASDFLRRHLDRLPRGRALDVACGDGRNALFLAQHGFRVDAIDIARAGLQRIQAIARREGFHVHAVQADLEEFPLARNHYDVVLNTCYLQRLLWPGLKSALRPAGIMVFETFLIDQREIGHPRNPAFLLERGELRDAFRDFDILQYEEGRFELGTGPVFLARLLARRPATWQAD